MKHEGNNNTPNIYLMPSMHKYFRFVISNPNNNSDK